MRTLFAALFTGTIFGAGLTLSDMVNPARVIAFLDLFGNWDPSLAIVMGGALIPSAIGYLLVRRMERPLFHNAFHIPENRTIDRQLMIGGAMFGAGWGLAGYCPGPALAGLAFGTWQTALFVAAMVAGMWLHGFLTDRKPHLLQALSS
ncbi:YeeE/YedE family protein [Pontixanthobacter gangjinensis]|uniref:YeeE/YedE family protein n=1 Tax=Pontixanthobacter gangjinensis TaxID=1028742 RepID=A0A6I4SQL1_9SPHN|nr:YeeE/YedE family protein [Pontixanthobacter gangjinensis]MXO57919.1 YeeE/YedE family protein [Pontixanthobacter gangjinensis]